VKRDDGKKLQNRTRKKEGKNDETERNIKESEHHPTHTDSDCTYMNWLRSPREKESDGWMDGE
jgi:hypothetical protein